MDLDRKLPLVTSDLPGTGGTLSLSPSTFSVEEVPLYPLSGSGDHVHLTVRREGKTTREVQRALAAAFGLSERDVGCAGQKDKAARATQAFSLPLREESPESIAARAAEATGFEVLGARRHENKLRRGHLAGNRFEVLLAHAPAGAAQRARAIAAVLGVRGMPNFFGEQRFGADGRNARRGRARLGRATSSWIARMELSAWQSALFNAWLVERLARGWLERVLAGDLARKTDTGGLFEVEDAEQESARCQRGEISPTGPIYGARMRWAAGEPGVLERQILASAGVDAAELAAARLPGTRRASRVFILDFRAEEGGEGLLLTFGLPKGSYATIALRELAKADGPLDHLPPHFPGRSGSSQTTSPGKPAEKGSQASGA